MGLAALAVVVAILVIGGGSEPYTVKLRLANAQGLRNGSPITVGGVPIGTVKLDATQRDVEVKLRIKDKYAPVGRNATAAVLAQNVLGQKQVRLEPGNKADPAPDGYTLPTTQIRETTDLDQLLATLDPDTRTRLAVLINETGTAFAGRKLDFKSFLQDLAPALSSGADVVGQLTRENRALTSLLDSSDHFVAAITPERRKISRMFDVLGRTTETVAARRAQLRETLRRAPGALASTRGFLTELRLTTRPLATTGRQLAAAAPPLQLALDRIEPFRRAAAPALKAVKAPASPALMAMSVDSVDDAVRLRSTVRTLKLIAQNQLPPVGGALDKSVDNLMAVLENWSRAIQFRDRLGHVFRGEATVAPDEYESMIRRLARRFGAKSTSRKHHGRKRTQGRPALTLPLPKLSGQSKPKLELKAPAKELRETVDKLVKSLPLPHGGQSPQSPRSERRDLRSLLDYLLG
jgi:virulence factor Mce-like protein